MTSISNKIETRRPITDKHLSVLIDKNRDIISLNARLKTIRAKSKELWSKLSQLNKEVERFERGEYRHLDYQDQEKKMDRLESESRKVNDEYMKSGEIEEDLEYRLEDVIAEIHDRYIIIPHSSNLLTVYNYGPNSKYNSKSKSKSKTTAGVARRNKSTRKVARKQH